MGPAEFEAREGAAEIISRAALDAALDAAVGPPPAGSYTAVGHPDAAGEGEAAADMDADGEGTHDGAVEEAGDAMDADGPGAFPYQAQLEQLQAMGFTNERLLRQVLMTAGGDVATAMAFLSD